ncbi:MAG TPA: hypothetical protein VET66_00765 [Steroidobacteraceae bacterium]|nr:hypothetical protein [Steroidobacteraceae bacterium]
MNNSTLKASEVEALTFIYTPAARGATRFWTPRSGTVGVALSWTLVAALAWIKFAAVTPPESHGL